MGEKGTWTISAAAAALGGGVLYELGDALTSLRASSWALSLPNRCRFGRSRRCELVRHMTRRADGTERNGTERGGETGLVRLGGRARTSQARATRPDPTGLGELVQLDAGKRGA
jgi:hypothetical protein